MASERFRKIREYEERLSQMTLATKDLPQRNRKEQESRKSKHMYQNTLQDDLKAAAIATWHTQSDEKMRQITVQRRLEALKQRREQDINVRRQHLAEKLAAEDSALRHELVHGKETPEQRRAKLAERARALAARREADRQETAAQLYEQAFRANCDVLRETNSKRVLYRTLEERQAQIEQKMATRIVEEEEKRMFAEMNEAERLKAEQRYLDDKRRERERREATLKILDAQVRAVEQRREDEATARRQEVTELRALWQRMAEEQQEADAADRERMRRLAAELQEFNRLKQMEMSERERRERELDLKILQEALSREASDEAREAAAREKRAEDVRRYREQLALMIEKDAEDNAVRDGLIQAAADAQQARDDAERAAREAARARLMAEVDAIRQQQIADKAAGVAAAMAEQAAERARVDADVEALRVEKERARAEQQKRALSQRLEIQTQMVAKAHLKAAEEDEKLRALEVASEAEKRYMGKVRDALHQTDPPRWYGRKKFDWYT